MKKFKLELACEGISIEYDEKNTSRNYSSYQELNDNDKIFYLCNNGNWWTEDDYYFDTLEEMQKYIENNELCEVKIYRCDNGKYELEYHNPFNYCYWCYEYNENDEEYNEILEDYTTYSKVVILDE